MKVHGYIDIEGHKEHFEGYLIKSPHGNLISAEGYDTPFPADTPEVFLEN